MTDAPNSKGTEPAGVDTSTDAVQHDTKCVVTKDRWEIILLLAKGHQPLKVDRITKENGKKMSIFSFGPDAYQTWHDFKHNVPVGVDNVRTLISAEDVFKGFID
jgi:hypothetical protein